MRLPERVQRSHVLSLEANRMLASIVEYRPNRELATASLPVTQTVYRIGNISYGLAAPKQISLAVGAVMQPFCVQTSRAGTHINVRIDVDWTDHLVPPS